jgi:hypothetical protein
MTEKILIKQLNKLQSIQADAGFREANRQLLLAQISQGEAVTGLGALARLNILFSRLFQPYAVAIMIVLFFAASGAWAWNLSQQSKPGDTLYIAKRLSERTKMLLAADDKTKMMLNLEFAGNRLSEISQLQSAKDETTAKDSLKQEFKSEINQVKSRLAKSTIDQAGATSKQKDFASAGAGKDNNHIDVSVPDKQTVTSSAASSSANIGDVLQEAENLFDNGAYNQAADKLGEANKIIDQSK